MNPKKHPIFNMGLRAKFVTAFAVLISISIALAVVGINNINRQVIYGGNVFEYSSKPNDYVAHMTIAFNQIIITLRDAVEADSISEFDNYMQLISEKEKTLSDYLRAYELTIEGAVSSDYDTYFDLTQATAADPNITFDIVNATSGASSSGATIGASSSSNTDTPISSTETADVVSGATTSAQKFKAIESIKSVAVSSRKAMAKMRVYLEAGNIDEVHQVFEDDFSSCVNTIDTALELILDLTRKDAESLGQQMQSARFSSVIIMLCALALAIILSIFIAFLISRTIVRPIKLITNRASRVAAGYFDTEVRFSGKDEIGMLSRSVADVSDTYVRLAEQLSLLVEKHEAGEINYRIDENLFEAAYRDLISKTNHMVGSYADTLLEVLTCVDGIAKGDFNAHLPQYPNQKAIANKMVDSLRAGLKNTSGTIEHLVENAKNGDLSNRASLDGFHGDWRRILEGINTMMDEIVAPIDEAVSVLADFSRGNLGVKIEGNYHGSFSLIKSSINDTLLSISSYVKEISQVLTSINNDNLNVGITREYVGDFIQMKDAINQIVQKFNRVLEDIDVAADEVSAGARKISDSAMSLADAARTQTDSVVDLEKIMDGIKDKTTKNAQDSQDAESLSDRSRESAEIGNEDMQRMLNSMNGIKNASDNISKIIKAIDDIAFQTNLLALNAAVEAARAGEQGKGFAVVAEEVRNLALRSQTAAKETSELIKDSINKVTEGTTIANMTAEALNRIVANVAKVSEIISRISSSSDEQAKAIVNVSDGLSVISKLVQNNSSAAEESASASQELLGQSETLKSMTSVFQLKK